MPGPSNADTNVGNAAESLSSGFRATAATTSFSNASLPTRSGSFPLSEPLTQLRDVVIGQTVAVNSESRQYNPVMRSTPPALENLDAFSLINNFRGSSSSLSAALSLPTDLSMMTNSGSTSAFLPPITDISASQERLLGPNSDGLQLHVLDEIAPLFEPTRHVSNRDVARAENSTVGFLSGESAWTPASDSDVYLPSNAANASDSALSQPRRRQEVSSNDGDLGDTVSWLLRTKEQRSEQNSNARLSTASDSVQLRDVEVRRICFFC